MGIVQKQQKKIENLEAKNRMLKRMYDSQKFEKVKAQAAEYGAEQVIKAMAMAKGGSMMSINSAVGISNLLYRYRF